MKKLMAAFFVLAVIFSLGFSAQAKEPELWVFQSYECPPPLVISGAEHELLRIDLEGADQDVYVDSVTFRGVVIKRIGPEEKFYYVVTRPNLYSVRGETKLCTWYSLAYSNGDIKIKAKTNSFLVEKYGWSIGSITAVLWGDPYDVLFVEVADVRAYYYKEGIKTYCNVKIPYPIKGAFMFYY